MSGFLYEEDRAAFEAGIGWPVDAVEISDRWYNYLMDGQTKGNEIVADEYGFPILSEPVVDYVAAAETEKSQHLAEATAKIAPLQDAVDLGIATDEEVTQLDSWKTYRVEVNRVDTSTAPDIAWPVPPSA
ncbi:MAG TPA: tail fiber assembly protein [Lelliottia sp.]